MSFLFWHFNIFFLYHWFLSLISDLLWNRFLHISQVFGGFIILIKFGKIWVIISSNPFSSPFGYWVGEWSADEWWSRPCGRGSHGSLVLVGVFFRLPLFRLDNLCCLSCGQLKLSSALSRWSNFLQHISPLDIVFVSTSALCFWSPRAVLHGTMF